MSDEKNRDDKKVGELTIHGKHPDGTYCTTRRMEDGTDEHGHVRFDEQSDAVYDYAVEVEDGRVMALSKAQRVERALGPVRVSTPEYRQGWDRIFGGNKAN